MELGPKRNADLFSNGGESDSPRVVVRKYRPGEEAALWRLFFETVRTVNRRDYSDEQVRAWAPDEWDEPRWTARIQSNAPYVCVHADLLIGFADVQPSGYIDQFFVHPAWQGRGVGKSLFAMLEAEARGRGCAELSSHVSITARPFFEARGFHVVAAREVTLGRVVLPNFRMVKRLA